jgi:hypothetical protein
LTDQRREEPVNEDTPTETQQTVRCWPRAGGCSDVSRGSHDAKRQTSGRSQSSGEFSFGAIGRVCLCGARRQVGLHAIIAGGNLPAAWQAGAERRKDGRDFGSRLDDGDGPQQAGAERTAQRVGAAGFRAARKPLQENGQRNS